MSSVIAHSFSKLMQRDFQDIRALAFLAALVIYGVLGSPTPDNPGWVEAIIGLLLIFAVGWRGAYSAAFLPVNADIWQKIAGTFLVFGIFMPLFIGIGQKNAISDVLRDILPFIFLVLPLFFVFLSQNNTFFARFSPYAVIFVGLAFALRALLPVLQLDILMFLQGEELAYFANMPTVLFAGLILGAGGMCLLCGVGVKRHILWGLVLLALSTLSLAAMAVSLQRATLGAAAIYGTILYLVGLVKAPYRMALPIVMAGAAIWFALPVLQDLGAALTEKNALVGLNMRAAEWQAVWHQVSGHPFTLLFGLGWGGTLHSPAVGGLEVNFTHSLLSSMLLKTGLFGLVLCLAYLAALGRELVKLILNWPVIGLAIAAPVLINVLLYASYKSLDFGLVLLMIPLGLQLMRTRRADNSEE